MASRNEKIYQAVTEAIIAKLEAGVIPWRKPWVAGQGGWPMNFASKRPYNGINVFMLSMMGYGSPYWLTYKQAKNLGGQVRKGEKSTTIVFWKPIPKKDKETGEIIPKEYFFMLKSFKVFNVEQVDGIEYPQPEMPDNFNPIENCEQIIQGMPNRPEMTHNEARAYYAPTEDRVNMPKTETFDNPESYYSVAFHELAHSTGHKDRLNRKEVAKASIRFGDNDYSLEELVAEMTAAMLCAVSGIDNEVQDNQAAYIQGWLKKLKDDPKMLVTAGGRAQKAADYILNEKDQPDSE